MSNDIIIDDEYAGNVGNATGYCDFIDWACKLPLRDYEEIIRFAEHGVTSKPRTLRKQLLRALRHRPPPGRKPHIRWIATELTKMILRAKTSDEKGVIVVTDGC